MSLLIQPTKEPSNLPSLPIIPLWMKHFTEREAVNHYHREGVSNLVIAREPIRISQDDYIHAKQLLKELKQIYSIKVSLNLISDIFKVVNALVSNPVSKDDFNFKMKAIYSAFRDYPAPFLIWKPAEN